MQLKGALKKHYFAIGVMQKSLDVIIIFAIFFAVARIFSMTVEDSQIALLGFITSTLFLFFANLNGLYKSWRTVDLFSEFQLLLYTHIGVILGLLILAFITKISAEYSRLAMTTWAVLTPTLLIFVRYAVQKVLHLLRLNGYNTRRVAVLGHGKLAQQLVREISGNNHMGIQIFGYYDDRSELREIDENTPLLPILGTFDDAITAAKANKYDELYIALPMGAGLKVTKLIHELSDCSVAVHMVPDLFTFNLINSRTSVIGRIPTVSIYESPLDDLGIIVKKVEDILLSSLILLAISVPMLMIAIGIKLTSKGPVLFKQKRYGLGGEEILVWKFRSMTVTENGNDVKQATRNDRRITPFGGFLRRTSLDELPQFINVLQGQMSIVGPRPHAVIHNELYRKSINGYMLRHLVKPGITGWAQINGWRGETDSDEKMMRRIEYDLDYIKNWSLRFDLKIIILTVFKGFVNKNAY